MKLDVARKYRMMAALPNIGVALCWMLVSKSRKCRCCCNFGPTSGWKNGAPFSATMGADVYETWQLWLERDVVFYNAFVLVFPFATSFSNYMSSKSYYRPTVGQNSQIFAPQNVRDTDRAPSGLHYKITHFDIVTKVLWGGVLRPRRLEREKHK